VQQDPISPIEGHAPVDRRLSDSQTMSNILRGLADHGGGSGTATPARRPESHDTFAAELHGLVRQSARVRRTLTVDERIFGMRPR